jgi:hypothetical protein
MFETKEINSMDWALTEVARRSIHGPRHGMVTSKLAVASFASLPIYDRDANECKRRWNGDRHYSFETNTGARRDNIFLSYARILRFSRDIGGRTAMSLYVTAFKIAMLYEFI